MATNANGGERGRQPEAAEKRYEQICASIRATDEISSSSSVLVPLLSGAVIVVVLKGEVYQSPLLWFISTFGVVVTFGFFRWELRNIQICLWLWERAKAIEPGSGQPEAPQRIGKAAAEKCIYSVTIAVWLAMPIIVSNPYYMPRLASLAYATVSGLIGVLTVLSVRCHIDPTAVISR
jgi:hypothetical protein